MVVLANSPRPDYAAVVTVVTNLARDLAARQQALGLSTRTLAAEIGVATTTVARLLTGGTPTQPTILAVLRWLATH